MFSYVRANPPIAGQSWFAKKLVSIYTDPPVQNPSLPASLHSAIITVIIIIVAIMIMIMIMMMMMMMMIKQKCNACGSLAGVASNPQLGIQALSQVNTSSYSSSL